MTVIELQKYLKKNFPNQIKFSLNRLYNSTKMHRRSLVVNPVPSMGKFTAKHVVTNTLIIESHGGITNNYSTNMAAFNIPVSLKRTDVMTKYIGNGYIRPISKSSTLCQVRCSCNDYYYVWWYFNNINTANLGTAFKPYIRKTKNMPYKNPGEFPGVCKHIVGMVRSLEADGFIVK